MEHCTLMMIMLGSVIFGLLLVLYHTHNDYQRLMLQLAEEEEAKVKAEIHAGKEMKRCEEYKRLYVETKGQLDSIRSAFSADQR